MNLKLESNKTSAFSKLLMQVSGLSSSMSSVFTLLSHTEKHLFFSRTITSFSYGFELHPQKQRIHAKT